MSLGKMFICLGSHLGYQNAPHMFSKLHIAISILNDLFYSDTTISNRIQKALKKEKIENSHKISLLSILSVRFCAYDTLARP